MTTGDKTMHVEFIPLSEAIYDKDYREPCTEETLEEQLVRELDGPMLHTQKLDIFARRARELGLRPKDEPSYVTQRWLKERMPETFCNLPLD
jgi:hypothetical protein